MKLASRLLLAAWMLAVAGCGPARDPNQKKTIPIQGQVFVDGQPAAEVMITLHDVAIPAETETANYTESRAVTDQEGKFQISTYELGDGAPLGEYVLTFSWKKLDPLSMSYAGEDKLKGRYDDRAKSQHKLTVSEDNGPIDMGRVELTTK